MSQPSGIVNRKSSRSLPQVVQNHRLGLWVLLLALSVAILMFPTEIRYEYQAMQSAHIFGDNLPLFGVMFYVWIAVLMLLLFAGNGTSNLQNLALVCVFGAVVLGFWAIATPDGGHADEVWNLGHVRYLGETGEMASGNPNLSYFQFPALHLLAVSISQLSGLDPLATRTLFLVFSGALTAALLYLLLASTLPGPRTASLAVLLVIQGSLIAKFSVFWPGNLAFLLFLALLALLAIQIKRPALDRRGAMGLVILVLLAAFITSYAPTPAFFLSALVGIYLTQLLARKTAVDAPIIILAAVGFLAWQILWATGIFGSSVPLLPNLVEAFRELGERFAGVTGAAGGYAGEGIPLWASLTRYSWLFLIFGVGGASALWRLARVRRLGSLDVLLVGGLLGVTGLSVVIYLAVPVAQWVRLMVFVPLFTVPLMLRVLLDPRGRSDLSDTSTLLTQRTAISASGGSGGDVTVHMRGGRRAAFALLVAVSLGLSLPTFLTRETSLTTLAVYPYEHATGQFLESTYGDGVGLRIFSSYSAATYTYYVPEMRLRQTDAPERNVDEEELWVALDKLADDFHGSQDNWPILVITERFRRPIGHPAAIDLDDPRWTEFVTGLAEDNRVFDNGRAEIYARSDS